MMCSQMVSGRGSRRLAAFLLISASASLLALGCVEEAPPWASARQITQRSELIGGTRALGEIGDFLMENDQIRVIIQGPGFSRGFGVFGGSLIDADLRRPTEEGSSQGGVGQDSFAELFPAFFLQATAVGTVEILSDGSDGGAARIRATGQVDDFMTMASFLNRAAIGSHTDYTDPDSRQRVRYETIYELMPGRRYVTIRYRVTNISATPLFFPSSDVALLLRLAGLTTEGFTLPVADVALFGASASVFMPGVGFDTRFSLVDAYNRGAQWPAFPGVVTDFIASSSPYGVSYGLIAEASDRNFVYNKRQFYDTGEYEINRSSLLIPFLASSFLGVFYVDAPPTLESGESFEVTKYFVLGSGDVGSVLDTINQIQGVATGWLGGRVIDQVSGQAPEDAYVIVYQRTPSGNRRIFSQYNLHGEGFFGGNLPPGEYSARVFGRGRPASDPVDFSIDRDRSTSLVLIANSPGRIVATVVDSSGRRLPAKVSVVGSYDADRSEQQTRTFLFDLAAGETYRYSDMVPDDPDDPDTRRYVETTEPTNDGMAQLLVRPGSYDVYISRGPEYNVSRSKVVVGPGETVSVAATLSRVVDTTGWIAADTHLHTINSIDASTSLDRRVRMLAAEGVEWAVATDHNYITDYSPAIARNNLQQWLTSSIGIELTTLESGHFNGYPLRYQVGPITHGAFQWSQRTPGELFAELRALGRYGPENTIVQVNHPRDTILGYLNQYRRDGLTGEYTEPGLMEQFISPEGQAFFDEEGQTTWSWDFDAFEILNGKRFDLIHHYRVPENLPEGELPDAIPPAGTILIDEDGQVSYPGALDDWYNLINLGYRYVAVGVSDSHEDLQEPGYARTMIHTGLDDPMKVEEMDMVRGLRSRRVFVTNGPMVDLYINHPEQGAIGQTLVDSDGTISLTFRVTAAPWISVGRVNLIRNGLVVHVISVDQERDLAARPLEQTVELSLDTDEEGQFVDSWFAVELIGYQSFFPIVRPEEIPPLELSDAIGNIAGSFGVGSSEYGDLRPARNTAVTAFAHTNPVWVTLDEGPFDPPGPTPLVIRDDPSHDPGWDSNPFGRSFVPGPFPESTRYRPVGSASPLTTDQPGLFDRNPGDLIDVRAIFDAFSNGQ
ncbi:MAG: CehA/McbA family metallohydrolase [Bradymonadales bacterium]|nr:CehA/McbA family metallohydrolase [Bradymonadales bacterium]